MEISRLEIIIEPWVYPDQPDKILKVRVKRYPGQDIGFEQVLPRDDLSSVWDFIWARAGEMIKDLMFKEDE